MPIIALNLKGDILKVSRKNTLFEESSWHQSEVNSKPSWRHIWVLGAQNWKLPTQLIIFHDFWAKILRIAHPVSYSYLPPWVFQLQNITYLSNFLFFQCYLVLDLGIPIFSTVQHSLKVETIDLKNYIAVPGLLVSSAIKFCGWWELTTWSWSMWGHIVLSGLQA